MSSKRYKGICSYEGRCFVGWQRQVEGISVQSALEDVLSRMHKRKVKVTGSGRTDKGVSAIGQVFSFDSELNIDIELYRHALNKQVPEGLYVTSLEVVEESFHPRKSAKYKMYQYRIYRGEKDIFLRNQVCFYDLPLDVKKMEACTKLFIGTKNFASFNTHSFKEMPNQVRTIFDIIFEEVGPEIRMTFIGNGFMRYMVRMISQTIIEVGLGNITIEDVQKLLDAQDKQLVSYMAKPQGLTLLKVGYEEYTPKDL